jgi:hypothetical protein
VIVAVRSVHVVQVPVDEGVHVITVRDGGMPAIRSMDRPGVMTAASMRWRAGRRIRGRDGDDVLLDRSPRLMMQLSVVEIIDVSVMTDGNVAAIGPVLVGMVRVHCHGTLG